METAVAAENAIENKRSKQTWIRKPCLFFCVCFREDVLNGKIAKTRKKLLTTLVSDGKLIAEC